MSINVAVSLDLNLGLTRYTMMYKGIQDYAKEHTDWSLFWDHYPEIKLKQSSKSSPAYSGIIGRIKFNAYDEAKRLDIPCVNLWLNSDLASEIPSVLTDFKEAGKLSAKHLINRGFKEITLIDFMDKATIAFIEGMNEIMKPMKYKIKKYRFNRTAPESPAAWEKQMATFETWTKEWTFPMAVASSGLNAAIPTFCKSLGIRIPEDLALIMCGMQTSLFETMDPHITSVDPNFWQQGYEAAKMLDLQLQGKKLVDREIFIQPKGIVPRASTDTYATEDKIVRDALRFIADNIDRALQVSDVVQHLPVSRSSLENRFKDATGTTIKEEINRLMVISAKRLLSDEKMKIKEVHLKAGFSSALHLRRIFKKHTGMTPGEFRKSLNQG